MADKDLIAQKEASDAVEAAFEAFTVVSGYDQKKVDDICEAMSKAALSDAARLGKLANEETGFGRAEDKFEKNRFAAEDVWNYFKGLKTVGVVADHGNIVEIASPRGVVAAIIPSTNPTSTAIFKILIAIKSRNTIVLSPHPSAANCIFETAEIMRNAAVKLGLPATAIQCLKTSSLAGTETLMRHKLTAVILATGGIGLVRAAYSSGKPAFGVGPGNVPVFIEKTADHDKAVKDILTSTCFDNGTICASEQAVVVERVSENAVREAFKRNGGYFLNKDDALAVGKILLTTERTLNAAIVGKSPQHIANLAGIVIPDGTRCLLADCDGVGRDFPWSVEKLSPTLAFYVVDDINSAAAKCDEILHFGGMGHTAGMHTGERAAAVKFGELMPASRIIINSPTTHGAIGLSTDLSPSMTLGCGSWGGNVTSDNVSPKHLIDIKRVAFETKPVNKSINQLDGNATAASIAKDRKTRVTDIVDRFLAMRSGETTIKDELVRSINKPNAEPLVESKPESNSPVKTIIHEYRTASPEEILKTVVDFVCEDDVRNALNQGRKIYINKKTIITPAAKDLGNEKDIFANGQ